MLRWLLLEARQFGHNRGPLFLFNTTLALLPVAVGYATFRRGRRPTPAWWFGFGVFLLFLPNAAYVLTDAIHLVSDARATHSEIAIFGIYVPGYTAFFVTGFTCYVLALRRLEENVRTVWSVPWWPLWLALQAVVAVGVYLGRVVRVNSWSVVTHPHHVLDGLATLSEPRAMSLVAFTFVVLCVGSLVWRPVVDAGANFLHRHVH
jgi:uncharacterized membrane protein